MAERTPRSFRRLIYLTCTAPPAGRNVLEQLGKSLHGSVEDETGWPVDPATTTLEERYAAMFCNDMDAAETGAFLARLGKDMWPMGSMTNRDWRYDHLAAVPSSYILCEHDMSLPPIWQQRFAERLHCERIVRINAGHQAMNTQPAALAALLLAEAEAR